MTNKDLAERLNELVENMTISRLALTSSHSLDEQLEQELIQLTDKVNQQARTGLIDPMLADVYLALISGLHLWNGSLDRSHVIAQDLDNGTGSYLHGILHRMEPDYSNAKYWFRLAGAHPEGKQLHRDTLGLLHEYTSGDAPLFRSFAREKDWNPTLFTDLVAASSQANRSKKEDQLLEQIQAMELRLLLKAELYKLEAKIS